MNINGVECWAMKTAGTRQMQVTEIRMIPMICVKTFLYKIANSVVGQVEWTDVEDIDKKNSGGASRASTCAELG